MSNDDPESVLDDLPNPDDVNLWVALPYGTPGKWWDEGHISNWIKENVYQVMQEHVQVDVESLDTTSAKERSICHIRIKGIHQQKRSRMKDLLGFSGLIQVPDPAVKTEEFFGSSVQEADESDMYEVGETDIHQD